MKYEAHITISISSEEEIKKIGLNSNWTFSKILGDPIMGKEAYCYLTQYKEDANELLKEMNAIVSQIEANNCKVLRCKIELICYDTKTNVNILENISSFRHDNEILNVAEEATLRARRAQAKCRAQDLSMSSIPTTERVAAAIEYEAARKAEENAWNAVD